MARALEGKVALVTGGAGGIGSAIAGRLAADGCAVAVSDVDAAGGERVAAALEGGWFVECDVRSPEACRRAVAAVQERAGSLDVLVSNAGIQHVAPVHEFPEEQWERVLAINLSAAFHLAKAALPAMYERGWGRIVNVASILGLVGVAYKAAYVASKHALVGLTKVIALEAAPHGVTANAICPAFVRTPLMERQVADQAEAWGISEAEVAERVMLLEPAIKRFIEPQEVAELVAYVTSDAASFLTGAALRLDGGYTAK